jgi:hypothetical protein
MAGLNGGQGGSKFHARTMDKPDSRQKRFVPAPPFGTSWGNFHANKAHLSGTALAGRRMGPRAQLEKNRSGQRKEAAEKVCGFPLTATGRLAQLRARGAQVRRSQAAQRDRISTQSSKISTQSSKSTVIAKGPSRQSREQNHLR